MQKSQELERVALARAVRWRLEHRILRYSNKMVVFD
jgi:formyltetrahydrofolate deformylase